MTRFSLKQALRSGRLSIGSWVTLAHPGIAEIMAEAGFDWLTVDLEHSVITIREMEELVRTIHRCGVAPLVRLTSNQSDLVKRVMDAGAHGIIVPMVNSKADVDKAFDAMHYPPKGHRGVGLARAQGYGAGFNDYCSWLEKEAVLIVQIEHIDAVRRLKEILSVPEVDGYIIGPYDLSASMGIPGKLDDPSVLAAIAEIKKVSQSLGKPGGFHVVEPDPDRLSYYIQEGFKFLGYSLDIRMLDVSCREGLRRGQV